jgi:GNAT superfamily N-acetyltransferase
MILLKAFGTQLSMFSKPYSREGETRQGKGGTLQLKRNASGKGAHWVLSEKANKQTASGPATQGSSAAASSKQSGNANQQSSVHSQQSEKEKENTPAPGGLKILNNKKAYDILKERLGNEATIINKGDRSLNYKKKGVLQLVNELNDGSLNLFIKNEKDEQKIYSIHKDQASTENNGNVVFHFADREIVITSEKLKMDEEKPEVKFKSVSDNPQKWESKNKEKLTPPEKTFAKGNYSYEYRSIDDTPESGAQLLGRIIAKDTNGKIIGDLTIGKNTYQNTFEASVEVDPKYRRKGIATAMYDIGEEIVGNKFTPAPSHTPYAEAFWKDREQTKVKLNALKEPVGEQEIGQNLSSQEVATKPEEPSKVSSTPITAYHGTDAKFTEFNPNFSNSNSSTGVRKGHFSFTDSKEVAESYGENIIEVNLDIKNPLVVDADNMPFNEIKFRSKYYSENINDIAEIAQKEGYDALIVKNVKDTGGKTSKPAGFDTATTTIVFNKKQIQINPTEV